MPQRSVGDYEHALKAERIDRLLETPPEGAALYRRCQQVIEPVIAHTKFLRRIDRFQRRGHQSRGALVARYDAGTEDGPIGGS